MIATRRRIGAANTKLGVQKRVAGNLLKCLALGPGLVLAAVASATFFLIPSRRLLPLAAPILRRAAMREYLARRASG